MSQNLERFGVEAVWLDAKFEKGVRDYNSAMRKADSETKKATASMSNSFDQNQKAIDQWLSSYKHANDQVQQRTRKLPQAADSAAKGFKISFTEIFSAVQLGIGALRTLGNVAQQAFSAAQEGAQQLAQARGFAIASGGAEQAAKNLEAMRAATRGTATDAELMNQALGILATGLATNEEELFAVTRNVTTLASTFKGLGAERALLSFQLLATDLERSEARLDDFGLTIQDVKPRMDELVASGMDLQEATRTALLEAMSDQMEALGLNAETTADSFGQLTATTGNLSNQFKQALAPAGAVVSDALVNVIANVDDTNEAFDKLAEKAVEVAANVSAAGQVMVEFQISSAFDVGRLIATEITGVSDAVGRFQQLRDEGIERGEVALREYRGEVENIPPKIDDVTNNMDELTESLDEFNQAISSARTQAIEAFIQRAIQAERQLEDAAIKRARKIEDIERSTAQKRAQIEEQFTQTIENLQAQAAENRRKRQIDLARQLEQIERNFQERKRAIQQQFSVSFQRAVRSRDALALVEAIRTRNRDLEEAKRQRDTERAEATTNAAQQEEEQKRSLERQIEAARQARAQQIADAQAAQAQQLDDLRRAELQQAEDRKRANDRWLEDQERAFMDRRVRAEAQYRNDEAIYQQHLQRMLQLTNTFIPSIFRSPTGTAGTMQNLPIGLAEGGAFIASGATPFVAGEAGPELVIAQPLSQIAATNPVSPQVAGTQRHLVEGGVQASMAGFQGRLTAAVNDAVLQAFREVLR